jgi:hypothetical protein
MYDSAVDGGVAHRIDDDEESGSFIGRRMMRAAGAATTMNLSFSLLERPAYGPDDLQLPNKFGCESEIYDVLSLVIDISAKPVEERWVSIEKEQDLVLMRIIIEGDFRRWRGLLSGKNELQQIIASIFNGIRMFLYMLQRRNDPRHRIGILDQSAKCSFKFLRVLNEFRKHRCASSLLSHLPQYTIRLSRLGVHLS